MLRLLVLILALTAVGACSHREPANPFVGPHGVEPLP